MYSLLQIDQQNAAELKELREKMTQTCKQQLLEREKKLLIDLKSDGRFTHVCSCFSN